MYICIISNSLFTFTMRYGFKLSCLWILALMSVANSRKLKFFDFNNDAGFYEQCDNTDEHEFADPGCNTPHVLIDVFTANIGAEFGNCRGEPFDTITVEEAPLVTDPCQNFKKAFIPTAEISAPPGQFISSLNIVDRSPAPNCRAYVVVTYGDRDLTQQLSEQCYAITEDRCLTFPSGTYRRVLGMKMFIKRLWCNTLAPEEGVNSPPELLV